MSTAWIEIDHKVLARIQAGAEAFVESPTTPSAGCSPSRRRGVRPARRSPLTHRRRVWWRGDPAPRARQGSILPLEAYEIPVLRALAKRGGSALRHEVAEGVGAMLMDELNALDREPLQGGEVRWENRLGFVRMRLIERGEMRANSRRGIWELSGTGAARLASFENQREEPGHAAEEQEAPPTADAVGEADRD